MGKHRKFNKSEEVAMKRDLLELMRKNMGILTPALQTLGIPTGVFYEWKFKDKEFAQELENIKSIALDFVESKLYKLIQDNDKTAIIFYLKCKGKDRGYIDRQIIDFGGKGKINFSFGDNELDENNEE